MMHYICVARDLYLDNYVRAWLILEFPNPFTGS